MRICLAQLNYTVGDIKGNCRQIIETIERIRADKSADLVVFSELAICGYPPEDLLLRKDLHYLVGDALTAIAEASGDLHVVIGHPERGDHVIYNSASVLHDGRVIGTYHKHCLPNYSVFDEKRYFTAGREPLVVDIKGVRVGLVICEDLWFEEPVASARSQGAQLIVSPNASPYHYGQEKIRAAQVASRSRESGLPIVYVNQVGGQDELVFDGRSMAFDDKGRQIWQASAFSTDFGYVEVDEHGNLSGEDYRPEIVTEEADVYQALVLGVRDYVQKNGFPGVLLGLSGGIDSALTLAVAVDALGPERVRAIMMPFHYTADISIEDAREEAQSLGCSFEIVPIEEIYDAFMAALQPHFDGREPDIAEQNIQARCRGTLLMAMSNKFGELVLTTGNKSEVAVGYSTLYGDMAGGFDVLKDVPKTLVYRLAKYRNRQAIVIPERVITRPPSAELAPDQKDEDNLPPYPVLDGILDCYIVRDLSLEEMVAEGYAEADVRQVMRLVDINEHKRRQAPPGVRISRRAFGRDRRYPITSGFGRQFKQ